MDECSACGFRYDDVPTGAAADRLRALGPRFAEAVAGVDEAALRRRPRPDVWSALEYGCHIRDVLLIQRDRTLLALVEDRPSFARMYRDERVILARYDDETPQDVVRQVAVAADLVARVFTGLDDAALRRPCVYNFPGPTDRDVAWLGRHTIHEGEHHLMDVRNVLGR